MYILFLIPSFTIILMIAHYFYKIQIREERPSKLFIKGWAIIFVLSHLSWTFSASIPIAHYNLIVFIVQIAVIVKLWYRYHIKNKEAARFDFSGKKEKPMTVLGIIMIILYIIVIII